VAKPVSAAPEESKAAGHEDGFSSDWGLDHIQRHDVAQADVAALMAYLPGLDFPVNSVGELPLSYLAGDSHEKAEAALVNAQGILEMYRVKEDDHKRSKLRYKPFSRLSGDEHSVGHRVAVIQGLIEDGQDDEAIAHCQELIKLGLDGLRYLQTYDWLFLRTLITAGYLGWIAFALTTVIDLHVLQGNTEESRTMTSSGIFISVLVGLWSFLFIQKSSWTYYAYAIFPVGFWEEVFARRGVLIAGKNALVGHIHTNSGWVDLALKTMAFVGLVEAMVSIMTSLFLEDRARD
jgi:phosphatidylinositol glycan class N